MKKTISDEYIKQNQFLHQDRQSFGSKGDRWLHMILPLLPAYGVQTILDYGAGKGSLKKTLEKTQPQYSVTNYDPVTFPDFSGSYRSRFISLTQSHHWTSRCGRGRKPDK